MPTKFAPSPVAGEPPIAVVDLDSHNKDRARRQAERDAKRDEMLKCLNPAYARARERAKPMYSWTVSAKWYDADTDGTKIYRLEEEVVSGHDENDAWAKFCDKVGEWPSRRDWKPTIVRGKQLSAEAVEAAMEGDAEVDADLPVISLGSLAKRKKRK